MNKRRLGMAALGVVLAWVWVGEVFASEYPVLFRGVRPLGMGGAFLALSDDENALFYNPAGLNDVKGFGGAAILNPYVALSEDSVQLYKDIQDVEGTDAVQVANLLNQHVGEHQHVQAAMFPLDTEKALKQLYPNGILSRYTSASAGKDFMVFFVEK